MKTTISILIFWLYLPLFFLSAQEIEQEIEQEIANETEGNKAILLEQRHEAALGIHADSKGHVGLFLNGNSDFVKHPHYGLGINYLFSMGPSIRPAQEQYQGLGQFGFALGLGFRTSSLSYRFWGGPDFFFHAEYGMQGLRGNKALTIGYSLGAGARVNNTLYFTRSLGLMLSLGMGILFYHHETSRKVVSPNDHLYNSNMVIPGFYLDANLGLALRMGKQ